VPPRIDDRVDEPVGVDGHAAVRQRSHVGQHIAQPGHGDRQAGFGGRFPYDGVGGVLAMVDGAAG
jgi:hypothetical protein